mmetsp:Transcript_20964/g.51867  ORF Transcript_20964/g.51867 Transcript_20964/m.51867 type:complete len:365 (+) Transcript_20964:135-1229(+)
MAVLAVLIEGGHPHPPGWAPPPTDPHTRGFTRLAYNTLTLCFIWWKRIAFRRLCLVEGVNAREHLALEELERGAAPGGYVRHLVGEARHLNRGNGVATANDGDGVERCQGVADTKGTLVERLHLKHPHGSVPDDRLALGELALESLEGVGADVKAHPAVGDGVDRDNLSCGIGGELVGDDDVGGEEDLDAHLLSLGHQLLGEIDLVVLNERRPDGLAQRLVKGEDHAAAEDDLVAVVEKGLDDANLGRHLGAAHNGAEGALRVGHRAVEVVQLLLQQKARDGRGEELGDARGGGVRAVRGAEGVVDVQVSVLGQLLGEVLSVLLLVFVESDVLQEGDRAVVHGGDGCLHSVAHAVVDLGHRAGQ